MPKGLRHRLLSTSAAAVCGVLTMLPACQSRPDPPGRGSASWRQVGSWHGRGDAQTENFTSDTGAFRIAWETRNETTPGAGRLYAVFRSGDSGREIMDAVNVRGVGHGVEQAAAERPRWYYLTIESANVDWAITVDEQIPGQAQRPR